MKLFLKKHFFIFILPILLAACSSNTKNNKQANETTDQQEVITSEQSLPNVQQKVNQYFKFDNDSVLLPTFKVRIRLTDAAKRAIDTNIETVKVYIQFQVLRDDMLDYSYDLEQAFKEYEGDGGFYFISTEQEINCRDIAIFDNLKIPFKAYNILKNKDFEIQVSMRWGTLPTNKNILDGELHYYSISEIANKVIYIDCGLSNEFYQGQLIR